MLIYDNVLKVSIPEETIYRLSDRAFDAYLRLSSPYQLFKCGVCGCPWVGHNWTKEGLECCEASWATEYIIIFCELLQSGVLVDWMGLARVNGLDHDIVEHRHSLPSCRGLVPITDYYSGDRIVASIEHSSGEHPFMENTKDRYVVGDRWTRNPEKFEKEHWIKEALGKPSDMGKLHHAIGVPTGESIPVDKLKAKAHKGGKLGRRAQAALNARSANK